MTDLDRASRIGKAIRRGIEKKGLKQKDLAAMMKKSTAAVSEWVSGKKSPRGEDLVRLAEELDIVDDLFPDEQKKASMEDIEKLHRKIDRLEQKIYALERVMMAGGDGQPHTVIDPKLQILVIDSEPWSSITVKESLIALGINQEVVQAKNGLEALNALNNRKKQTSLIILDLQMPEIDGLLFLKIIKNNEKLQKIPIVILGGDTEKVNQARKFDVSGCLYKPFDFQKFSEVIRSINIHWPLEIPFNGK